MLPGKGSTWTSAPMLLGTVKILFLRSRDLQLGIFNNLIGVSAAGGFVVCFSESAHGDVVFRIA